MSSEAESSVTAILYQFPPNTGNFRASAPCVAIEAYLRLSGIEYQTETKDALRRSDTAILPAVSVDGKTISDSEKILRYFESRSTGALDSFLSQNQQAEKLMLWRLMNGSIYQFMVAERWLHPEVYPDFVESFRRIMLPRRMDVLWPIVKRLVTRRVRGKYLKSIAHLSGVERLQFTAENFSVLDRVLGDQEFLFGDRPSSADAFLFAYTYAFLATPFRSPTRNLIETNHPNLVSFYSRMAPKLIGDVP